MSRKVNTVIFVKEATEIHGGYYSYENTIYVSTKDKVKITCKVHGEFEQSPNGHLSGRGCIKCGNDNKKSHNFVAKAAQLHGSLYDYTNVNYTNNYTKVAITCSTHGDFFQRPYDHLRGGGCPKCASNSSPTTEEFIVKANLIHNFRYAYSDVAYESVAKKINITCGEHGAFLQTPANHLQGKGCPTCSVSRGELSIAVNLCRLGAYYVREKEFADLTNSNTGFCFRYDFYLPSYNSLIEYDGEHHYKQIMFDANSSLSEVQERDMLKNEYAINNGIRLLRIPYTDLINIPTILDEAVRKLEALVKK